MDKLYHISMVLNILGHFKLSRQTLDGVELEVYPVQRYEFTVFL